MTFSITILLRKVLIACIGVMVAAATGYAATEYVEGEALVTFKEAVDLPAARQALHKHTLSLAKQFKELSEHRHRQTGLVRWQGHTTVALIDELKQDASVETVEPNYLRWATASVPTNDTLFAQLWGLQNTGQVVNGADGTAGDDIRFVSAWNSAQPAAGEVVVAVIDTGVDHTHPDLVGNMWTNAGEVPGNGVDDDGNGYADDYYGYDFVDNLPDPMDSGLHGTHVSGTIAATGNNHLGVVGVNPQAKIMALKASSDGSTFNDAAIIEATQYATMMKNRGVNIVAINASFGGVGQSVVERAAIQAAGDVGIIFCAAAGNDSANNDTTPTYPASYRLPNMIVVAASDQNDALASFSNYGITTVDLAAPGVNILSTIPVALAGTTAVVRRASVTYAANGLTYAGITTGITAAVYYCGLGYPGDFPAAVNGNIALISRGTLHFTDKVSNATAAGARAAIIYNNVAGNFQGTLQYSNNWIPAVSISQADGQTLQSLLPTTVTVVNSRDPTQIYQYLDGTSMATPHVAGAAAFAAMNYPAETVAQRIQRILGNVDAVAGLQTRVQTGGRLNLSRTVTVIDANPPAVSITSPAGGTTYTNAQTVTLTASASDSTGVTKVEFYDTGTLKATDTTAPYTYTWGFTSADGGAHDWTARAYDAAGNVTTSAVVTLTVNIPVPVICTYTLAAPGTNMPARGGSGTVTVNVASPCPWAARSNTDWLQTTSTGTGTSSVQFTVAANTTTNARTGTLTMQNQSFIVSQPPEHSPVIIAGPVITNALLSVFDLAVVPAGTNVAFLVTAVDSDGDPLTYQWAFGDGTGSTEWMPWHTYETNTCGAYTATVVVADGIMPSPTGTLRVAVACQLNITRMQLKPNFAKRNADSCTLRATFVPGADFGSTGQPVTVDIGDALVNFVLNKTGHGAGTNGTCTVSYNKRRGWTIAFALKAGAWHQAWTGYDLLDATIKKGVNVQVPVVVLIGNDAYAADQPLTYTATAGKSGTAK